MVFRFSTLQHKSLIWQLCLVQDAVGNRVTVVLQNGEAVRVALPFAPARPLPKLALDALRSVLPAPLFHSLCVKHLLLPGAVLQMMHHLHHATMYIMQA